MFECVVYDMVERVRNNFEKSKIIITYAYNFFVFFHEVLSV